MSTTTPAPTVKNKINPVTGRPELEVDKIFRQLIRYGGSDLHMQVGKPPILRVKGTLRELQMDPIDKEQMLQLFMPMMDERNTRIFEDERAGIFTVVNKTSVAGTNAITERLPTAAEASTSVPLEGPLSRVPSLSAATHSAGEFWRSRMTRYSDMLKGFRGCEESWSPGRHWARAAIH